MKVISTILLIHILAVSINAQDEQKVYHHAIKLDSTYLFVDNSPFRFYTLEFVSDTLFHIAGSMYYIDNGPIQINSIQFNNGKPNGVKGSTKGEEFALEAHKKWELDYQKSVIGKRLKNGEELYKNRNNKQFLIWWYKIPKNTKNPTSTINIGTDQNLNVFNSDSSDEVEILMSHQIFLDFIIYGTISVSISSSVPENSNLENEINKLKRISNSLNVYAGPVDLLALTERSESNTKYKKVDSLELVEITIPDWFNLVYYPKNTCVMGTFPEKDNIYNALSIIWEYKQDGKTFANFIDTGQQNHKSRNNIKTLVNKEHKKSEFYTKKNGYFHCQDVYMEGESVFCHLMFTATSTTYEYNINRFNEIVNSILLR